MDYLQLDITGQALALYSDGIYLYSVTGNSYYSTSKSLSFFKRYKNYYDPYIAVS